MLLAAVVASLSAASIRAAPASSPVVVELFTSQGCSSCPDADELLSKWGGTQFKKGTVLPLTYNVDYWNYLGWKDVFSTPAYSQRQRAYAAALGVGVYTPQMVVAGRSAFVGSDGAKAMELTRRFQGEPARARIVIEQTPSPNVKLTVQIDPIQDLRGNSRVMLALFENGLTTQVLSGENKGSILETNFVVRKLIDLGALSKDFHRAVAEHWDASWSKGRAGAAVFIQNADTLAISGAQSIYPLK